MSEKKVKRCRDCDTTQTQTTANKYSYCLDCLNIRLNTGSIFFCISHSSYVDRDTTGSYINRAEEFKVCSPCFRDEGFFICDRCDDVYSTTRMSSENGICDRCNQAPRVIKRKFDPSVKKYISKDAGEVITSKRTFGVELEVVNPKLENVAKLSHETDKSFGFERDSSIKGDNPIEIVTPILGGKKGEDTIKEIVGKMNKMEFFTNKSCGMHVHCGGEGFFQEENKLYILSETIAKARIKKIGSGRALLVTESLLQEIHNEIGVQPSRAMSILLSDSHIMSELVSYSHQVLRPRYFPFEMKTKLNVVVSRLSISLNGGDHEMNAVVLDYLDDKTLKIENKRVGIIQAEAKTRAEESDDLMIGYHAKDIDSMRIKLDRSKYILMLPQKTSHLRNVKTLLYLHSAYQDFFYSMLPSDRRDDYKHCQNLGLVIAPRDIPSIHSQDELEELWYKTRSFAEIDRRKTGSKYDPSRYFGLNLHSLFTRGTVEIRYHAGTTNINSILFWVAFNQHILDSIVTGEITMDSLSEGIGIFDRAEKGEFVINALKLPDNLESYVRSRIDCFSDKK